MELSPFLLGLLGNTAIASVIVSLIFLVSLIKKRYLGRFDMFVALSVGLILGVVFLWFLPEVFSHSNIPPHEVGFLILIWILFFYTLELFIHWHHCKDLGEDEHSHHDHDHENSPLIAFGTFFDNLVHGVILFSAFSISYSFGVATTLALLFHAIPQNIANLLMNHRDTKYVYIAAFGGILGALLVYPFQSFFSQYIFHILALIAGGLLYTAMSDMLPSFKKNENTSDKFAYLVIMIIGIVFFSFIQSFSWEHEHAHESEHINEIHHDEEDEHEDE